MQRENSLHRGPVAWMARHGVAPNLLMALLIIGFAIGDPLLDLADHLGTLVGLPLGIGRAILVGGAYAIAGIILLALQIDEELESNSQAQPRVWQDIQEGILQ